MNVLPKAFDVSGEANLKLARFKQARAAKWNLRSSKSLWDIADLATYLLALARSKEAVEIGNFVSTSVSFDGNYNLWTPAAQAIGVGSRAARLLGLGDDAETIYRPIKAHPSFVLNRPIEEQMFRQTPDILKAKSYLLVTRNNILRIEDARAGRPGTEWYPIAELESYLAVALDAIRKSLGGD